MCYSDEYVDIKYNVRKRKQNFSSQSFAKCFNYFKKGTVSGSIAFSQSLNNDIDLTFLHERRTPSVRFSDGYNCHWQTIQYTMLSSQLTEVGWRLHLPTPLNLHSRDCYCCCLQTSFVMVGSCLLIPEVHSLILNDDDGNAKKVRKLFRFDRLK